MRPSLQHPLLLLLTACLQGGCAHADAGPVSTPTLQQTGDVVLRDLLVPGGAQNVDLLLSDGQIAEMGAGLDTPAESKELDGRWVVPAFIDSHVHLAYLPEGEALLRGGIAGAVDMAAPAEYLAADTGSLRLRWSGPMITAEGGYPTQSWGRNGYGEECADAAAASAAVESLADQGARLIKLPVTSAPVLDDTALAAAVTTAHARGLQVASHATSSDQALTAATAGADVLAHTPTQALSDEVVAAWADGAVVSTLAAFGGGSATVANLGKLHDAGAVVLYGTDFGNTRTAAIQESELRLMMDAGLSGAEILASGTSAPATYWGFDELGSLGVGKAASLLVLDADPLVDPLTLSRPVEVWIDGVQVVGN